MSVLAKGDLSTSLAKATLVNYMDKKQSKENKNLTLLLLTKYVEHMLLSTQVSGMLPFQPQQLPTTLNQKISVKFFYMKGIL
jgi:hypothetical protein